MFEKIINEIQSVSAISEKIVFRLVNTKMNESVLKERPHRKFLDLSSIYFLQIENGRDNFESLAITDQLIKMWNIEESELWELALKNMLELFPPQFTTLESILMTKLYGSKKVDEEEDGLLYLSNTSNFYGASCIFYPKVLENIRRKIQNDYYIIPSSVHEVLILLADSIGKEELNQMIQEVNATVVESREIFGGYPWFHKKSSFETNMFPWSPSMQPRQALLDDDFIHELNMEEYALNAYEQTIRETPVLPDDSPEEKRRREIAYLNIRWFMATLLDRMDRAGMYSGLEARVPFADYRIVEYVFNIPWDIKCPDGIVKGLLRHAGEGILPKEILWRRKSPYPKTYDPHYEALLADQLKEVLASPNAPIRTFLDKKKVLRFLDTPSDYGKPWYGQLMAGPQMLAYMLQVNYWMEKWKHPLPSGCS